MLALALRAPLVAGRFVSSESGRRDPDIRAILMKRGKPHSARVQRTVDAPSASLSGSSSLSWPIRASCAAIVAAGSIAYANSFSGVFLLDDYAHIVTNDAIRSIGPITKHLENFRPLVQFTLAVNYAVGGLQVGSYHALNLAIHLLAGLTLFGIVRRTLLLEGVAGAIRSPTLFACTVAVIWVVHPIQTQAVTYLIQRGESMMGLFYLLTLYCAIRAATSARSGVWTLGCVAACAAGMLSKEAMVTAPISVFLLDAVFLSRSWTAPLKRRWALYLSLAATWSILMGLGLFGDLLHGSTKHASDIGFRVEGLTPWRYLLTQPEVLLHYARLCFWPSPLCLDYGWEFVSSWREAVVPGSILVALLALTAVALWRRPKLGMLGAFVFVVLAPTSSIVPIRVFAFEHRMYLPLAAIIVLVLLGALALRDRLARAMPARERTIRATSVGIGVLAIAALCGRTFARNADYGSATRMWADVVAQRPRNARAWNAYGVELSVEGRLEESMHAYERALALEPDTGELNVNMGKVLAKQGRFAEAVPHYRVGLKSTPEDPKLHHSLAIALKGSGQLAEAATEFRETLRLDPSHPFARFNLGMALAAASRWEEAEKAFSDAIRQNPGDPQAQYQRCACWVQLGRREEAVAALQALVRSHPNYAEAARLLASLSPGR
jgi:Flp pilus assembly protein TadD